ncbi:MAG TPA: CPBP family intramembrane glutamic endopeptidase [Coleofasciculaceae cyanobacterium]
MPIVYTLTFVLLSVWARQHLCRLQINFKRLIGYLPNNYSWLPTVALIIAILLFSLGSGQLFYYILSFPAPTLVDSLLQQKTFLSNSDTLAPLLHNLLIVIVVTLVAPITEELIFRGILLHRWAIKWGVTPGLLLSTSLFAVFHANIIGLFVFGLMMALLYIRTRTLIVPIVCHALNNFIVIGLELVSTTSNTVEPTDLLEQLHSYWWVGVVYSLFQASEIRMV